MTVPALASPWREEFKDLGNWEPLAFKKIPRHSSYTIVTEDGRAALRCESRASASGLLMKRPFDPRLSPRLRFAWKVDSVYAGADPRKKSGDDYPLRVYVLFAGEPGKAGWLDRLAGSFSGRRPPHSVLNYVWAGSEMPRQPFASPYTSRSRMIPLQGGSARAGTWIEEQVDILKDYQEAFGEAPPKGGARLAIMNDSDNTRSASVSFLSGLELSAGTEIQGK